MIALAHVSSTASLFVRRTKEFSLSVSTAGMNDLQSLSVRTEYYYPRIEEK